MRRVLSNKKLSLAVGSMLALLFTSNNAFALDYSSEDHCFSGGSSRATIYVDDEYANGTLHDEEKVDAVEQLITEQWSLRLSVLPFEKDSAAFRGSFSHTENGESRQYKWYDAWTAAKLFREKERFNRRTGSKYIFVPPQMKQLSRERAQIRIAKQKPCNPHILYLG